jgi:heme/copper-type cytochrome/quinol oxidase subunit 2
MAHFIIMAMTWLFIIMIVLAVSVALAFAIIDRETRYQDEQQETD